MSSTTRTAWSVSSVAQRCWSSSCTAMLSALSFSGRSSVTVSNPSSCGRARRGGGRRSSSSQSPPPRSCAFPCGHLVDNRPRSGDNRKGWWISLGISRKSLTDACGRSNIASPQRNGAVRDLRSDRRLRPTENPQDRNETTAVGGRDIHRPHDRGGASRPGRAARQVVGGTPQTSEDGVRTASAGRTRNGHRPPEPRLRRAMWVIDARLTPGSDRLVDPRPTGGPGAADPLRRGGARGHPRFGPGCLQDSPAGR